MIKPEDRHIVIAVATQFWCARLQYMAEAKQTNGQPKSGYSPDMTMCVGEAAAMLELVDNHIAPKERQEAIRRRRTETIELEGGFVFGTKKL